MENTSCFTELFDVRLLDSQVARYETVRIHQEMCCMASASGGIRGRWWQWPQDGRCQLIWSEWDGAKGHKVQCATYGRRVKMVLIFNKSWSVSSEGVGVRWSQGRLCHLRESEWDGTNGHKADYANWWSRSEMVPMVTGQIMPTQGVGMRWCQWSQGRLCHLRESEWDGTNGHKADYANWGSRSEMVPMVTRQIMPTEGVGVRWCQWSQGRLYQLRESEWDSANGHKTDYAKWSSRK